MSNRFFVDTTTQVSLSMVDVKVQFQISSVKGDICHHCGVWLIHELLTDIGSISHRYNLCVDCYWFAKQK